MSQNEKKPWHVGAKTDPGQVLTVVTTLPQPFNTFFVAAEDFGQVPVPMMVEAKQEGILGSQQIPIGGFMRYQFKEIWIDVETGGDGEFAVKKSTKQRIENVLLSEAPFLMYPVVAPLWWANRKERK